MKIEARKIFSVAPRSLRIFTILLGILTLWDVLVRFPESYSFYSSSGILSNNFISNLNHNEFVWSINLIDRSVVFQQILFIFQAAVSIVLLTGIHRPLVNLILWILVVSRHVANPYTLSAGDELLRFILFWSCFIPKDNNYRTTFSSGSLAFAVQLLAVYFFSALMKYGEPWRVDGTAIALAFKIESFTLPLSRWLLNYPEILKFLTFSTLYLEAFLPLLFIITVFSQIGRTLLVLLMIIFHIALAATFRLGFFPFVCIAAWVLWLPEYFWQTTTLFKRSLSDTIHNPKISNLYAIAILRKLSAALCVYLSLFCLGINFNTAQEKPFNPGRYLVNLGNFFQLWQKWGMFAPFPSIDDGWNQFKGILKDNSRVYINGRGGELDGTLLKDPNNLRPKDLGESYKSAGWKKFLYALHQEDTTQALKESYLEYLCKETIRKNPGLELSSIEFFYNVEWTRKDLSKVESEKVFVMGYQCL